MQRKTMIDFAEMEIEFALCDATFERLKIDLAFIFSQFNAIV